MKVKRKSRQGAGLKKDVCLFLFLYRAMLLFRDRNQNGFRFFNTKQNRQYISPIHTILFCLNGYSIKICLIATVMYIRKFIPAVKRKNIFCYRQSPVFHLLPDPDERKLFAHIVRRG
jgi:hypothetical protein